MSRCSRCHGQGHRRAICPLLAGLANNTRSAPPTSPAGVLPPTIPAPPQRSATQPPAPAPSNSAMEIPGASPAARAVTPSTVPRPSPPVAPAVPMEEAPPAPPPVTPAPSLQAPEGHVPAAPTPDVEMSIIEETSTSSTRHSTRDSLLAFIERNPGVSFAGTDALGLGLEEVLDLLSSRTKAQKQGPLLSPPQSDALAGLIGQLLDLRPGGSSNIYKILRQVKAELRTTPAAVPPIPTMATPPPPPSAHMEDNPALTHWQMSQILHREFTKEPDLGPTSQTGIDHIELKKPARHGSLAQPCAELSANQDLQSEIPIVLRKNQNYVNPPAGSQDANSAAPVDLAAIPTSNAAAQVRRNWADITEEVNPGAEEGFTLVQGRKRRRGSGNSPTTAAPSSNAGASRTIRRPQSSAGSVPRAQEIRATRAHIADARARQASSSEEHCVYIEHSPELEPFHYLRALDRKLGGTAGVIQITKVNGHQLLGLTNRGLAERLISEGLEVEGTLLRAFPFRKRAERITVSNLPFFVADSAVITALSPYGRVTSIAPKQMKAGPYVYVDGRRDVFITLHEGITIERLPTRLDINIKGEAWPAYLSSGIRCSRCHGQGHRRAICPLLAGLANNTRMAPPTTPAGVPPPTTPAPPQRSAAQPPAPTPSNPAMEETPPAPPPVTPAPSLRTPGSREPAAPTPDVEMSIVETFASSTSSAKNATRVDLDAFIEGHPSVSFAKTDALGLGREEVLDLLSSRTKAQRKGPLLSPPQCDALAGLIGQILDLRPGAASNLYKVLGQVRAELRTTPAVPPTPPLPAPRPAETAPPAPQGEESAPAEVAYPPPLPVKMTDEARERWLLDLFKELNYKTFLIPLLGWTRPEQIIRAALHSGEERDDILGAHPNQRSILANFLGSVIERARGAEHEPARLGSESEAVADLSAENHFQGEDSRMTDASANYANLPIDRSHVNFAAACIADVTPSTSGALAAATNWAEQMEAAESGEDSFTVVKHKRRRRESPNRPVEQRSSGVAASRRTGATPRRRPTAGGATVVQEIRATRADIADARVQQRSSTEDNCVFVEHCPDFGYTHYLQAVEELVGGAGNVLQVMKMDRHMLVGLSTKALAERLLRDGLEIGHTHLRAFPFKKRAERITVANLPFFVDDAAVIEALRPYGDVTSIVPIRLRAGRYTFTDGRREVFILLKEGSTLEKIPTRVVIRNKGNVLSAFISYGVKCSRCGRQGHRRANCPINPGRASNNGQPQPAPLPPGASSTVSRQQSRPTPAAPALPMEETPSAPPVTPATPLQAPEGPVGPRPAGSQHPEPPPARPDLVAPRGPLPAQKTLGPAASTPVVEMSIVEETFTSSTSSAKNATRVDLDAFIEGHPSVSFAETDALGLGREEVLDLLSSRTKAQRKGPLLSPPQCDALVGLIGQILDLRPGAASNLYKVLGQVKAELRTTPAAVSTPLSPAPRPAEPAPPAPHGEKTTPDMATPPPPLSPRFIDERWKEAHDIIDALGREPYSEHLSELRLSEGDITDAIICPEDRESLLRRLSTRRKNSSPKSSARPLSALGTYIPLHQKPVRHGSPAQPCAELSANQDLQSEIPIVLRKNQNYVNPSAGSQDANSAAPVDLAAIPTSNAAAQVRRNWADITEEVNPGAEEGFTLVQGRKRRRGSANSPTAAAPSSNPGGSRTIRRPQPSARLVPRAQEIPTTRAHIAEARARQASSAEEHCVYQEHGPELHPFHYLRALDRLLGGTAGVVQVSKVNGHQLLGLANRGLAERLINNGLEVEGTLLRAFPFRKRAERITVGNLPFFVEDSAIIKALGPYGRITSIAPKMMKAGPYTYTDGRREAFIVLHEGVTTERLPTRLNITIKGEAWPAYLSSGIKCSRCHGQGHLRANCLLLSGRTAAPGPATPTSPTSVPPATAPRLPQQPSAQPPPPASPSPTMEVSDVPPTSRAALHPPAALRQSLPAPSALPAEDAPPVPPTVTPAPFLRIPGSREPAAPTPDVEMSIVEETSASPRVISKERNENRPRCRHPSVSFAGTDALGLGREEVLDLLSSRTKAQRNRPLLSPPQGDALAGLIGQILDLRPGAASNLYKVLGQVKAELRTTPAAVPTPPLPAPRPAELAPPAPHGEKTTPDMATPPPPLSPRFIDERWKEAHDIIDALGREPYSEHLSELRLSEGDITDAIICPEDREPLHFPLGGKISSPRSSALPLSALGTYIPLHVRSSDSADQMPGRHSIEALPCAKISANFNSQRNISNIQEKTETYANSPAGERNVNSTAPFNLAANSSSNRGANAQRNWADYAENVNSEEDDSFTVAKGRKRRRDSPDLPAMAAQSSSAGASRRQRPSTGRMPQVQEIRTTRAHYCPEYQTYQYMKAMEKVVGSTRNIVQFTKVNGQYLVGLANRSLAERLVREGLEIEGTLLKTFPFRRTSIRVTIGNLPFFVGDAAVMDALSRYGRITSIAPKQLRVGEFDFTDGRREAFILLHDGITVEMLPSRFELKIKGEPWPAFLTHGVKCSKCRGQANCPQLHGRPTTSRRASPPPSTSLPPSTAPGLPRRTSAAPPAPAPPSPAMEVCSAPPVARAVLHPSAPRPSPPAAPALPMEETPSAPPPVTPAPSLQAPEGPVGPRPASSQHPEPPPARPEIVAPRDPLPAQKALGLAAPTPDVEMSIVEETSASSTSSAKNATRVDLDAFIEKHPSVSFAGTDALGLGREEVLDLLSSRTKAQRKGPLLSPPQCDALAGLIGQILVLRPGAASNLYKVLGQVKAELRTTPAAVSPTPPTACADTARSPRGGDTTRARGYHDY
ncbi:hypothetical protein LAZ67_3002337 [Cordylochernes scorpioides]|uniref:CCHC-type domain-containing protein n=1 Tax=Cordylochernes scorpioides TaxID=51811 RepID=A0ABY6K7Q2_9ARAC|nr:hypothetical protein LAZ67_3002337 [Cordylochernes scorpioides]